MPIIDLSTRNYYTACLPHHKRLYDIEMDTKKLRNSFQMII